VQPILDLIEPAGVAKLCSGDLGDALPEVVEHFVDRRHVGVELPDLAVDLGWSRDGPSVPAGPA